MKTEHLKKPLERLYRAYGPEHLSSDPLVLVRAFPEKGDREVAGLIAAAFAYGRVSGILRTVGGILEAMGESPLSFVLDFDLERDAGLFRGMVHRFHDGRHIVALVLGMQRALRRHGSLGALFRAGYSPAEPDMKASLTRFVQGLLDGSGPASQQGPTEALDRLLPSPRKGSACKRLNMYLRWMVRRGDGLDLGLWPEVSPAHLILPLDTHLFRICVRLGLTQRRSANWAAAEEITGRLRRLDPDDPVKYDFALARLGILGHCGAERDATSCRRCVLGEACLTLPRDGGGRRPGPGPGGPRPGFRRKPGGSP